MKRKLLYNIGIEAFFVQQILKNSKTHKKIDSFLCSRRSDFWEGSYEKEMEIAAEAGDGSPSCGCYGGRGRYAGIRLYQTEERQADRSRK